MLSYLFVIRTKSNISSPDFVHSAALFCCFERSKIQTSSADSLLQSAPRGVPMAGSIDRNFIHILSTDTNAHDFRSSTLIGRRFGATADIVFRQDVGLTTRTGPPDQASEHFLIRKL